MESLLLKIKRSGLEYKKHLLLRHPSTQIDLTHVEKTDYAAFLYFEAVIGFLFSFFFFTKLISFFFCSFTIFSFLSALFLAMLPLYTADLLLKAGFFNCLAKIDQSGTEELVKRRLIYLLRTRLAVFNSRTSDFKFILHFSFFFLERVAAGFVNKSELALIQQLSLLCVVRTLGLLAHFAFFTAKHSLATSKKLNKIEETALSEAVEGDCPICYIPFEKGNKIKTLPCNPKHFFHTDCIHKWLKVSSKCPCCRENVYKYY